jgi:hypothetical protein
VVHVPNVNCAGETLADNVRFWPILLQKSAARLYQPGLLSFETWLPADPTVAAGSGGTAVRRLARRARPRSLLLRPIIVAPADVRI